METEVRKFIKVWTIAIASTSYIYFLSKIFQIPKGIPRLLLVIPVIYLFILIPTSITSIHLGGPTFFYLVWLANFKLLLYSFDIGPLCTQPNNSSLLHFVATALLPIKAKNGSSKQPVSNSHNIKTCTCNKCSNNQVPLTHFPNNRFSMILVAKLIAFALVVKLYEFQQELPKYVLLVNYCCHVYLGIEFILATSGALARTTLGLDMDPQFNEPYLATSLQDFWGRRWNLVVTNILRLSVYNPIRCVATPLVGRRKALIGAVLVAFFVSGLMHEVIYFYITHVQPTWEVTCFFVLQGVCTVGEVLTKEAVGQRVNIHRFISGPLTIGFVGITGWWLLLPQLIRNGVDVKATSEYPLMLCFVKKKLLRLNN